MKSRRRQQYMVVRGPDVMLVVHGPRLPADEATALRQQLRALVERGGEGGLVLPRDWVIDPDWQEASEAFRGRGLDEARLKELDKLAHDMGAAAQQGSLIPGLPLRASVVSVATLRQWSGLVADLVAGVRRERVVAEYDPSEDE